MRVHEYQAKAILARHGVPVPKGEVAFTPAEAGEIAGRLGGTVVVKAQIHAGGRGKGKIEGKEQRGVAVGKNAEDVKQIASNNIPIVKISLVINFGFIA